MGQLAEATRRVGTARSIYLGLREQITGGVYAPGDSLPSSRALAEELGVSRTTVTTAFDQLISEGYVLVRQGARPVVAGNIGGVDSDLSHKSAPADPGLSAYAARAMALPPSHLARQKGLRYDFRYGDVAADDFPKLAWRKALTAAILARRERMGYGDAAGNENLRQALQGYLWRARGIRCDYQQIVVVNGSQQGLDLCARALLNPGDRIVVEEPCYAMARNIFVSLGAKPTTVACDSDGIDTSQLPTAEPHRFAFVTPSHQYPLGGILSIGRRRALLDWAENSDAYILEDDYDGEYRYDVRPIPPLYLSGRGRVIYIGTVSKTLSPTLRLGYLVLPPQLVEPLTRIKQLVDRQAPTFEQDALASLIESGTYERHVRKMRRLNGERRQAFLQAMGDVFGDRVEIVGTSAGLHVVVWFNEWKRQDETGLIEKARAAGIGIYPVSQLYAEASDRRAGFVFGYASMPLHDIPDGVRRLGQVLLS
ncbi:PLP-dependent aminotransferase family protein [Agrobacterium sp.]|uniref:MocR-like pyridoxine biosynthesis transcription factor PdxR n=1 Tax=Agrobacterium sp. TaxID=361 RepID=UPI0028AE341B|nr:PLP-dependent aminotransferase family protein [Agrobacterium sp.]